MRRSAWFGCGMVVSTVSLVGYAAWRNQPVASDTSLSIRIAADELELGVRDETTAAIHRFHIDNPTPNPVRVVSIRSNCDCLSLTPAGPFDLAAGERREVTATVALRMKSTCQRARGDSERASIPLAVAVERRDGMARSFEFTLTASVQPALRVAEAELAIGLQSVRPGRFEREVRVEVAPHVRRIAVDAPPAWSVHIPDRVPGERAITVNVRTDGPLYPRTVADVITLTPHDEKDSPLPASEIVVRGEFAADVQAVPRVVCLGGRSAGQVVEDVFVLRSLSGTPFVVRKWSADDGMSVEPVRTGTVSAYRVHARVDSGGEREYRVAFVIDAGDPQPVTLTVPVVVHGFEGETRP